MVSEINFFLATVHVWCKCVGMTPTHKFANAVGRKKMAQALELLPSAISNAVGRDNFPPAWYDTCKKLAADAGVDCPPELFAQRPLAAQ